MSKVRAHYPTNFPEHLPSYEQHFTKYSQKLFSMLSCIKNSPLSLINFISFIKHLSMYGLSMFMNNDRFAWEPTVSESETCQPAINRGRGCNVQCALCIVQCASTSKRYLIYSLITFNSFNLFNTNCEINWRTAGIFFSEPTRAEILSTNQSYSVINAKKRHNNYYCASVNLTEKY